MKFLTNFMQAFFLENITCAIYILKCIYICQFKPNLSPIAIRWSNLKINVQKMYLSLQLKMVKLLQSTVYIQLHCNNIYKDGNEESFKMIRIEVFSKYR